MKLHPHPNPTHIMRTYRAHFLASKRRFGSTRALIHFRAMYAIYREAKRLHFKEKS